MAKGGFWRKIEMMRQSINWLRFQGLFYFSKILKYFLSRMNGVKVTEESLSKELDCEKMLQEETKNDKKETFSQIFKYPRVMLRLLAVCLIK